MTCNLLIIRFSLLASYFRVLSEIMLRILSPLSWSNGTELETNVFSIFLFLITYILNTSPGPLSLKKQVTRNCVFIGVWVRESVS